MKLARLLVVLLLFSPLYAVQQVYLSSEDVKPVMEQLFEYHIDKKAMDKQIIERSLNIYLNQFDPTHAYLYLEEAQVYMHPNEPLLEVVLSDYKRDRFGTYFTLDRTIQESILRARVWRERWVSNPEQIVREASEISKLEKWDDHYAVTKKDLQRRHYQRMVRLTAYLILELQIKDPVSVAPKVVALCEKQMRNMENRYLAINERGLPHSEQQAEHLVIERMLKAMAHSLDAHTAYYSPDEAYAMKVQLEKGMCGIGVVLREGIDGITIHEILKGGPADLCGALKVGDTIVAVNGEHVQGATFQHVLEVMRGKDGSQMVLGMQRSDSVFDVSLIRKQIAIEDKRVDISYEPYGEGIIGKVTLHSFYEGDGGVSSEKDLKKAIAHLRTHGELVGLVLDMRENSGGFLSQAVKVSGLFISSGVVVISKYSDGNIRYLRVVDGQRTFDGPLVVLISRGSASATEIVAQTLQDYGVALVVGDEQSYGKGTIQHQTVTESKSAALFKVTVGRYYTASGKSTQIHGVRSDIVIPTELSQIDLGEKFLEYPLHADRLPAAFEDPLTDIDPMARRWFAKYYVPAIQPVDTTWIEMKPTLIKNSEKRMEQNANFKSFLQGLKKEAEVKEYGQNDLQMEESVNILKDMIYLHAMDMSSQ